MKILHKILVGSLCLLFNYSLYSQQCQSLIPNYQNDETSTTNSSNFELSIGSHGYNETSQQDLSISLAGSGWLQLNTSSNYANIISTPWNGNIKIISNSGIYKGQDRGYLISPHIVEDTYKSPLNLAGSGTMLGAKTGGGIHKELNFIEEGYYYLFFSQLNATKVNELGAVSSSRWAVTINGVTKRSIYMPNSTDFIDNTGNWKRAFLKFYIPSAGPYDIKFKVENMNSPTSDELYVDNYLLLDNIELYREGECNAPARVTQRESSSFKPAPGNYVLSAWVKEEHTIQQTSYSSNVDISFNNATDTFQFYPSGHIIDGWQRIEGIFSIPNGSTDIHIVLNNNVNPNPVYFDDIRIHRADGSMKSFVYDPMTQRLMAELDENNYATLYEYDQEGGLVRVKKETERGIYTIQETRSGNSKLNTP
ncbi:hypothetical protein [Hyunsoonleella ulvae]|uniref:hypothetical protein n=1 Tax=Hyunsoonleella ulvae TaxID=2799948 RepID=UPI00193A0861|nr:hypothetical protein [Hyunsoonleella ulvae]